MKRSSVKQRSKRRNHKTSHIRNSLIAVFAIVIAIGFLVLSFHNKSASTDVQAQSAILWTADHEEGNMSDWYVNDGGGEFNNGQSSSQASTDFAHGGSYSAKMTITPGGTDTGVRLFRWNEGRTGSALYYSVWYYFPQQVTASGGWWNIFQWKSRGGTCSYCSGIDPMWILHARNRSNGAMHLMLEFWPFGHQWYDQTIKDIPVGQWFHVEAYYKAASDNTGQLIVWQDGTEIFNRSGIQTIFNTSPEWSVNNYANSISPSTVTIYTDDAVISTTRIGQGTSPTAAPTATNTPTPTQVPPTATPVPPTPTQTPTPTVANVAPYIVYSDALAGGWSDQSWGASINYANTSPVYSGTRSIRYRILQAWAGLDIRNNGFSTGPYTHLRFAARASTTGQKYSIFLKNQQNTGLTSPIPLTNLGGNPTTSWKLYTIPLATLNGVNRSLGSIVIHDDKGSAQPNLFIDDIRFIKQ